MEEQILWIDMRYNIWNQHQGGSCYVDLTRGVPIPSLTFWAQIP